MAKRPKPSGLRKIALNPDNALPLLTEAGVIAAAGVPTQVFGYVDRDGRPRRILAHFSEGWRADLHIHVDGSYSLTQSRKWTFAPDKQVA